ncbi:MAG: beta-lactamase family protein [Defluviitaleaceae bacterium]|nr:beta-lactamase family protein [Defluviitaleaceae bacterium]
MYQLDDKTLKLIAKTCKGKTNIKLTVGYIDADGDQTIKVFDETGEIRQDNYIYEIGSITKTFTASLMAKQIYEGRMSPDDSISKYIDGLDSNTYYPTLKRLVTHTSGYATHLPLSFRENMALTFAILSGSKKPGVLPFQLDLDKMKKIIRENPLKDKDYKWKYSNFAVSMAGYAVGVASGKGYWDAMNDFISNELGLENTYTGTRVDKNLRGFTKKNEDIGNWVWNNDLTAPAGDLSSTAEDLLKYARINLYEEKPYLALCHQKHAGARFGIDMGLGWIMLKKDNNVLWHTGGTGAFRTYLAIDKGKKLAVTVLANYTINPMTLGDVILENLQK